MTLRSDMEELLAPAVPAPRAYTVPELVTLLEAALAASCDPVLHREVNARVRALHETYYVGPGDYSVESALAEAASLVAPWAEVDSRAKAILALVRAPTDS